MIGGQSVLAIITARGGSKGVPRKNIRMVGGKPLIAWSIDAAKGSRYVDRLVLSSDDLEIINTAVSYGCEAPFVRDSTLAQDDTPSIDVVLDAITRCPGFDWVLLLQPTSPLRSAEDIDKAIELCLKHEAHSCVSVHRADESPFWMFTISKENHLIPILPKVVYSRRQDLPPVHMINGAIYLANVEQLKGTRSFISEGTVAYEMPAERSLDIDTELDFKWFDFRFNNI